MTAAASSLLPRLERAADRPGWITFVESAGTGGREVVEWRTLHEDARAMAAALQARGVAPRDHVAILGPTTRALVTAIQATWLAGGATVMLPLPMRLGSIDDFVHQTRARIVASDAKVVLADPQLAAFLDPHPGDPQIVLLDELTAAASKFGAGAYERPADDPDALAILQYTSGSTSDPKGVMLPHRCVAANIDAILEASGLEHGRDVGVSWLPLYHDMGLIGLLATPMTTGMSLALAAPQDFLAAPARWMEWLHEFRGTATAGPNFAYALAARALRRMDTLDLSAWRIAINGAEPIDPDAVASFVEAGARHGVRPGTMFPAFGMAEATLAVTFVRPGAGLSVDTVDRRVLETDAYAAPVGAEQPGGHRLAKLGRPIPGLQVRICEPATGRVMRDREVGELEITGASVTPGYYKHAVATADAFHDGWLRTGDLAYLVDGELVVCGRIKDVIILGGRNVYPQDVERAVADIAGVRAGNVIAFGTEGRRGKEALVVVAEMKAEGGRMAPGAGIDHRHESKELDEARAVRDAVAERVRGAVGVPPEEVVLVRPGTLPKTSSGKLQRALCRERYLGAALELL